MKSLGISRELGVARFDCLQPQYSLVCRSIEREHLPLCREEGVGVIPWSPLGGGLLTGKIRRDTGPPPGSRAAVDPMNRDRYRDERNLAIAECVAEVARELGRTPGQVALAWVAQQPGVTAPIFGARTLEQIHDNLGAADLVLDREVLERLDRVSALPLEYPYDFHLRIRALMGERGLARG